MNYVTFGVIGHVDHGKTTLVKALTGVDTDRLKEEKARGISIALGYTHLELPSGEMGIIDAPGHEKFIRTMVSGATGIEAVLLLVDINEGVKPQTIEHLDIAELLGVNKGIIVVTKCDIAQPGRRQETLDELELLLDESKLRDAPVLFTSSQSGEGLDELKNEINAIIESSDTNRDEGMFYLPIDRVFSLPGFGTIVTGTLRRGGLRVGEEVEIYPHRRRAKVRELQTHNRSTQTAEPGHRTAVNLRGVDKKELARGDILATPDTLFPTRFLDAELTLLKNASAPLKHGQVIRLLFGTVETYPHVHLLEGNVLEPGQTALVQFKHEETVAALNQEPFIIRTYSPMLTIGGGRILGTTEARRRRRDAGVIEHLHTTATGSAMEVLHAKIREGGANGVEFDQLCKETRLGQQGVRETLKKLDVVTVGSTRIVDKAQHLAVQDAVLSVLKEFHAREPTLHGLTLSQLITELAHPPMEEVLNSAIADLLNANNLKISQGVHTLSDFDPAQALSSEDRACADEIEMAFKDAGLAPPGLEDVLKGDKHMKRLYRFLVEQDVIIAIRVQGKQRGSKITMAYHRDAIEEAKQALRDSYPNKTPFTMSEARNTLNTSRKYAIPVLELFDTTGFTKRDGDHRVVLG